STTSSSGRSRRRPRATPARPSGISWASGGSARAAPPCGASSPLLVDVEPFLHPASGVPDLAGGDVLEQVAGADLVVLAHPPDAEVELAPVVAVELARTLHPGLAGVGEDE